MSSAAALFPDLDGHWFASWRSDPRAAALYRRHYSAEKNARWRRGDVQNFMGSGETLVLLSADGRAMFAWLHNTTPRLDGQLGVCCTVFRNEGAVLSSDLIREADEIAWRRWPGLRHFTYVDSAKTSRRRSKRSEPGACFLHAGWKPCGRNADGRLTILEIYPPKEDHAPTVPTLTPGRCDAATRR